MYDLYAGSDDSFCVGMAGPYFSGVFSFARYNPRFAESKNFKFTAQEKKLFLLRSCKVAAHEIAHNVGVDHCCYYQCMMNGSGHLSEDFAQPIFLCPVDLRKIVEFCGSDVLERYDCLLKFFEKEKMTEESNWIKTRIKFINDSAMEIEETKETPKGKRLVVKKKEEASVNSSSKKMEIEVPSKKRKVAEAGLAPRRSERLEKRNKL